MWEEVQLHCMSPFGQQRAAHIISLVIPSCLALGAPCLKGRGPASPYAHGRLHCCLVCSEISLEKQFQPSRSSGNVSVKVQFLQVMIEVSHFKTATTQYFVTGFETRDLGTCHYPSNRHRNSFIDRGKRCSRNSTFAPQILPLYLGSSNLFTSTLILLVSLKLQLIFYKLFTGIFGCTRSW